LRLEWRLEDLLGWVVLLHATCGRAGEVSWERAAREVGMSCQGLSRLCRRLHGVRLRDLGPDALAEIAQAVADGLSPVLHVGSDSRIGPLLRLLTWRHLRDFATIAARSSCPPWSRPGFVLRPAVNRLTAAVGRCPHVLGLFPQFRFRARNRFNSSDNRS
jgi:hypothetical protein